MEKCVFDKSNGLWYVYKGGCYFPLLGFPYEEEQPIGLWGRRHLEYIKEHRPTLYNDLVLSGKLNSYLSDIDQQAHERLDTIIKQAAQVQGITEELKATKPLVWVGKMNNIRCAAEEIMIHELIMA